VSGVRFRLGFAVKVVGGDGLKSHDARRRQSGPSLETSLDLLEHVFDHLERQEIPMYRLSSSLVPYGTHPDLPQFDYRLQIDRNGQRLAELGERARLSGLRLSTHPGQYTRLNAPDPEIARKAALDVEQDTLVLDALSAGPEAVVVVHVGGAYGDPAAALNRFATAYERLSDRARDRLAVEHDDSDFDVDDVLELHRRTGVKVVFDHHHHRCNPGSGRRPVAEALAACMATWPPGTRPKAHLSSPRSELRVVRKRVRGQRRAREELVAPLLEQHADFATPWDLLELLDAARAPLDVMVEAKAKDIAVVWLRRQLLRVAPDVAALEERPVRVR
jgi:UV DNA damage endonuclease